MPEGHVIHRLANAIGLAFAGSRVEVTSPQDDSPNPQPCWMGQCWPQLRHGANISSWTSIIIVLTTCYTSTWD
ncbi:formamidopyrimidine-DNA glycosylase [Cutibacterium acnes JCM 18916]|nr:formamidopyrimidine-DNA glycosylase [Cutibacterium acnes JCM 18916]